MERNTAQFELENDPQVYTLTFDFNEIVDAEPVTGCNLLRVLGSPSSMNAAEVRGLLYAMLKTAHPIVDLKEAGDLLTRDMGTVTAALATVMGIKADEPAAIEPDAPAA